MINFTPKPDCDRCGFPYHRHNGDFRFCPFISTYRAASAIEARRVETEGLDAKHESAVAKPDAPTVPSPNHKPT